MVGWATWHHWKRQLWKIQEKKQLFRELAEPFPSLILSLLNFLFPLRCWELLDCKWSYHLPNAIFYLRRLIRIENFLCSPLQAALWSFLKVRFVGIFPRFDLVLCLRESYSAKMRAKFSFRGPLWLCASPQIINWVSVQNSCTRHL